MHEAVIEFRQRLAIKERIHFLNWHTVVPEWNFNRRTIRGINPFDLVCYKLKISFKLLFVFLNEIFITHKFNRNVCRVDVEEQIRKRIIIKEITCSIFILEAADVLNRVNVIQPFFFGCVHAQPSLECFELTIRTFM